MEPTDELDAPDRRLPESRVGRFAQRKSASRPSSIFLVLLPLLRLHRFDDLAPVGFSTLESEICGGSQPTLSAALAAGSVTTIPSSLARLPVAPKAYWRHAGASADRRSGLLAGTCSALPDAIRAEPRVLEQFLRVTQVSSAQATAVRVSTRASQRSARSYSIWCSCHRGAMNRRASEAVRTTADVQHSE